MRNLVTTATALALLAGCASAPKPKAVAVAKPVKVFKPAQTVEQIQAAFDEAVAAMQGPTPDLATARAGFEAALKAASRFPAALFNLGMVDEMQGRLAEAEGHYRAAAELLPEGQRGSVQMALAKLYLGQADRLNDAESLLQQLLAKDPTNLVVKHNLAVLYRKQKDYDTALKFLREILAREAKNIAALNELGLLYLDQKNHAMSHWILGKAMQFSKAAPNADVLNNMGLLWMAKGETPGAVQMFQKALAANANHISARKNLGALYVQYLNFQGAGEQFAAVLASKEADLEARLGLATSLFGQSQFEPAEVQYRHIVEQLDNNPRNAGEKAYLGKAHYQLGRLYQEFLRDQEKALASYKQWVLHGNPPQDHPKLQEIKLIEDMVRRGVKAPEAPAEPERPSPPTGATDVSLEGVDVGAAMDADPDAPDPVEAASPAEGAAPAEGEAPANPAGAGEEQPAEGVTPAAPVAPTQPAPAAPAQPEATAPAGAAGTGGGV